MGRFTDQEELRQDAKRRLARRRGTELPEDNEARKRLEARMIATSLASQGDLDAKKPRRQKASPSEGSAAGGTGFLQRLFARVIQAPLRFLVALAVLALAAFVAYNAFFTQEPFWGLGADGEGAEGEDVPTKTYLLEASDVAIPESFDPGLAERLKAQAEVDHEVLVIANQINAYGRFGPSNQENLIKLALDEPAARPFVGSLPSAYPVNGNTAYSEKVEKGRIPRLYQWDTRWAFKEYSSAPLGLTGCCPTAFSMVYMGLTGRSDMTPGHMADLARERGYMSAANGTVGDFLVDVAPELGLVCFKGDIDPYSLRAGILEGYTYICNVGAGDFTVDGHFFVITGLSEDGRLIINDPFSEARSNQLWDIDQVVGQSIALYALAAP
ncbi:MAG: C39 family peptidase [Coriobacteriaceae bacterium]|jgi:hypothetical protein|nr:C39 family peptidase [Coriobacteriaceae bacterium]